MTDSIQNKTCDLNFDLNNINEYSLPLDAVELLEDMCIHVIDKNGKIIYYSKGCEKIEKCKRDEVLGKQFHEVYNLNEETSMQLKVLKTGNPVIDRHVIYKSSNNDNIDVISSTYPIKKNEEIVAAICVYRNITQIINMSETIKVLQKDIDAQKRLNNRNGTTYYFDDIIASSNKMSELIKLAKKVAVNNCPILLKGETGTGKELFAQSIHNYSSVQDGSFVPINCSAIPENLLESILFGTEKGAYTGAQEKIGLFEKAKNGTLFLDEINSMSMTLQAKLLRVLETKTIRKVGSNQEIKINTRIISATNEDPVEAINNNNLRSDLFYRLAVVTLEIPPLRNRMDDLPDLIKYFIHANNKIMGKKVNNISSKAFDILSSYHWPGNVRQLKHAIDYCMNIINRNEKIIETHHLPEYLVHNANDKMIEKWSKDYEKGNYKKTLEDIERKMIINELKRNDLCMSKAAKKLGVSRQSLRYTIKKLGININNL